MERVPSPRDLHGAANVARTLAYVVGLVGVIGGAVVQRGGSTPLALAIWVITFAAGAVLMIAGFLCDGIAALLARTTQLEMKLSALRPEREPGAVTPPGDEDGWTGHPNPW